MSRATTDELHLMAIGIALPRHDFQPRHAAAHHQRLAAADEDVETAVVLRDHGHADVGRKLTHRFVAGIEQVVRLLAVGGRDGDRLVQAADAASQPVDLVGDRGHLLVGEAVLLGKPVVHGVEAPRQPLGFRQHQLARGNVGRVLGRSLQRREEALQRRRDTGRAAGQQRVELVDLALVGRDVAVQGGAAAHLVGEEFAIGPANVHQGRAGADITGAAELRRRGGLAGILPAETRRVDVGDVVAGNRQLGLAGAQAREADIQQVSHD